MLLQLERPCSPTILLSFHEAVHAMLVATLQATRPATPPVQRAHVPHNVSAARCHGLANRLQHLQRMRGNQRCSDEAVLLTGTGTQGGWA